VSASEERERIRAWVERQRGKHACVVAEQETIEQALIALRASTDAEREARSVHAVKAQLEADFAESEHDRHCVFEPASRRPQRASIERRTFRQSGCHSSNGGGSGSRNFFGRFRR
jgi:hypothetical protein